MTVLQSQKIRRRPSDEFISLPPGIDFRKPGAIDPLRRVEHIELPETVLFDAKAAFSGIEVASFETDPRSWTAG